MESENLLIAQVVEHLEQVQVLLQQGKTKRAAEILSADLERVRPTLSPHHGLVSALVTNLADCYLVLGNYAIAEQLVEDHLAQLDEDDDEYYRDVCRNVLANIYMRTLRIPKAEAILRKSIEERNKRLGELHPSHIPEYYLLAIIFSSTGRFEEGQELIPRMVQMREHIPPGYQDAAGLAQMVNDAIERLGVQKEQEDTDKPLEEPGAEPGDITFIRHEAECWRQFVERKFNAAAHSALELLIETVTLRLLEIRLLSLLWIGESTQRDGEKALAIVPPHTWQRALVEFTLGRTTLEAVLELATEPDDFSQIYFYAGLRALWQRNNDEARECFQKASDTNSDTPEQDQAALELKALNLSAQDITQFGSTEQTRFKNAYHNFALLDYSGFLNSLMPSSLEQVLTPQLLLMFVVSLRACGQVKLSDDLIPHVRILLSGWSWHLQLLDLITGKVAPQTLLSRTQGPVEVCQLHYYALVYMRYTGSWEEALIHREAALKTTATCPELELAQLDNSDPLAMVRNVNRLMRVLTETGQMAMAESLGGAALRIARKLPELEPEIFASVLANVATVVGMEGKLAESIRLFSEVEKMASDLPAESVLHHLLNAGQLYLENGLLAEASQSLAKAFEISQSVPVNGESLIALFNAFGRVAGDTGQLDLSIQWHEKALSILKEVDPEDALRLAIITDNIGISLALKGSYQEAIQQHEQAYQILSKETVSKGRFISDSHPSICKIITNWAWSLALLGQYDEAVKRANEALKICELPGAYMEDVKRNVLYQLAMTFAASGRASEALEKLTEVAALDDRELGGMMALDSDELRMGYAASATFSLTMLLTVAGSNFSKDSARVEAVFNIVLRRKGLVAEAAAVRRDAILLGRYPSLRPMLEELSSLQRRIAAFTFAQTRNAFSLEQQAELDKDRQRKRNLEASLAEDIPELQLDMALRRVNARQLLSNLPTNWSIVEFVQAPLCNLFIAGGPDNPAVTEDHFWAFVIPFADLDAVVLVDLGPASEFDEIVARFLSRLDDSADRRAPSIQDLREKLEPVFAQLPRQGHVLIAPEGSLAQLPFEVLTNAEGQYLIDRYSFSYVATCRDLVRLSISSGIEPSDDVVVADPDFDYAPGQSQTRSRNELGMASRFAPLPGTRQEGKAIAEILGVEPWLGADAQESRIMELSSPRILHLATHGFFQRTSEPEPRMSETLLRGLRGPAPIQMMANPLFRSGLAVAGANVGGEMSSSEADGLISAAEVTGLNLLGTELVVLSACETGLGTSHRNEGIMGLRRAFQLAGASSVIASLWKVPDQQTCDLMTSFYRRLMTGMPRGEALRAAQFELRQKFPSPFYWGAFVCFGETRAIAGTERLTVFDSAMSSEFARDSLKEIAKLSASIKARSFDSQLWWRRGLCYHNLHHYAEAIDDFNRAIELAPKAAVFFFSRGFTFHRLQRFQEAIADFDRAIELQPSLVEAYHRRANTLAAQGEIDLALKDFDYAIELDNQNADIFYDRAGILADDGRHVEAKADYSAAIKLRPSFAAAYVNRGTIWIQLNEPIPAIEDLETAVRLVPDDALAHLNLGSAHALSGNKTKAVTSWQEATRLGDAGVVRAARKMQAAISRMDERFETNGIIIDKP